MPNRALKQSTQWRISDHIMSKLRQARLRKAARRKHRPCKVCGSPSLLCPQCIRTYCISCHSAACPQCQPRPVQPSLTQSPIESRRNSATATTTTATTATTRSHHKKQPETPIPTTHEARIPANFRAFAGMILATGGYISQMSRLDKTKGQWTIQVVQPKEAPKPKFDSDWFGHRLASYLNIEPSKKGMVIDTVILETGSVERF